MELNCSLESLNAVYSLLHRKKISFVPLLCVNNFHWNPLLFNNKKKLYKHLSEVLAKWKKNTYVFSHNRL